MSNIKKLFVTVFTLILITLIFTTTSNARSWSVNDRNDFLPSKIKIGDTLKLTKNQAKTVNNLFCVYKGQSFGGSRNYKAITKIQIVGKTATDQKGTSYTDNANAELAYILSTSNGQSGFQRDSGNKPTNKAQSGVWYYIGTWMGKVGKKFDGIFKGFTNAPKAVKYDEGNAKKYAESIDKNKLENKAVMGNVSASTYTKNGKTYYKIGPFKYNFREELKSIVLYDTEANKSVSPDGYLKYEGTKAKEISLKDIKPNKTQFYVLIPTDCGLNKIDQIKVAEKFKVISADIVFWEYLPNHEKTVHWQNLINFVTSEKEEKNEGTWPVKVNLFIDLSGKVWEDVLAGKDNTYENAGKDYYTNKDTLLKDITVRLKDKNGNIVKNADGQNAETKTDDKGEYKFTKILASELKNYNVEFEYDGLEYTTVKPLVEVDKTKYKELFGTEIQNSNEVNSKAKEIVEQRKSLNNAFGKITNHDDTNRNLGYIKSTDGNTINGELQYNNGTSESTFVSTTYDNKTYSGTNLTANTKVAEFKLEEQLSANLTEIKNVNLGLVKRENPNIGIRNDITSVQLQVNGYGTTYTKDSNGEEYGKWTQKETSNINMMFGVDDTPYYQKVYPSDINYSDKLSKEEDAKKLKVYAKYVVKITNYSNSLSVSVPEIVNYHDSNFEIVADGTEFPDGTLLNGVKILSVNDKEYKKVLSHTEKAKADGDSYQASIISLADAPKIEHGKSLIIEITYKVKDETILALLNGGDKPLNNVTEIYSYASYYSEDIEGCKAGDIYAGIDKNSAPGNAVAGDKTTYEDDTDSAPIFKLTAKGVRQIEGTVFEDKQTEDSKKNNERLGNGEFDNDEGIVGEVKVELLKADTNPLENAKYFPDAIDINGETNPKETSGTTEAIYTSTDGKYIFRGVEPDNYLIRFTYGKYTENGKEYVTKIYDTNGNQVNVNVQDYKSTIITSKAVKDAFEKEDNPTWYKEDKDKRYSDARDNEAERNKIDEEIKEINGKVDFKINTLSANTPKFTIPVEYESIITDATIGNKFVNTISNIDFGITERAKQEVALGKEVSHVKVTLANGQVLIDGDPRKEKLNYVAVTKGNNGKIEQIELIVDNELIQGAHVEIQYEFAVTNNSEVDYVEYAKDGLTTINKSYYYYGETDENSEKVGITSATIIDYVDYEMVLQEGQAGEGKTWKVVDLVSEGLNWGLSEEEKAKLLKNYNTLVMAEPINKDNSVKPGETKTTSIIVEKLLGNSDNNSNDSQKDLIFENNGEVVKVSKTGGRNLTTTLGSYATQLLLGETPNEVDEVKAAQVTVTPPYGSTDNTTTYAIIAVISLAILGLGVYGTRRFLKK